MNTPASFLKTLHDLEPLEGIFNPWRDFDSANDRSEHAPAWRSEHLQCYLDERVGSAKLLLVGEAPGYRGCKYSGVAMTSERMLAGQHKAVSAQDVVRTGGQRTSHEKHGPAFQEPTASITWSLLMSLGLGPRDFVFWNAFPCHPHRPGEPLTNRAPSSREMEKAAHVLPEMLALLPQAKVLAVGRIAERTLQGLGVAAQAVRHPAMGGANLFRSQVQSILAA